MNAGQVALSSPLAGSSLTIALGPIHRTMLGNEGWVGLATDICHGTRLDYSVGLEAFEPAMSALLPKIGLAVDTERARHARDLRSNAAPLR